ncbi:MAG TPA: adenylate/guanylate cyclase domain-containing protein [Burkholderiales bacterium]|nr:adenylate/guanylate cyclase domain-containing protein [Burkholderiales bacterium]
MGVRARREACGNADVPCGILGVKCASCEGDNPAGTKFCGACGARLLMPCPVCSALNPVGQKYCGECGAFVAHELITSRFAAPDSYLPRNLATKILMSRASLEGERKQVSIMFADIKGSLELLADRDAEESRILLDAVLTRMLDAVHRYEGTVNQVMGDGVMAIFGAPVAHEDHAVRACYAGLHMKESLAQYAEEVRRKQGISVQPRIGIHSGEVVVRSIGSDLHMDYTAVGQTTHLAARMEQIAPPGSILVTADVWRLAEGFVEAKSLGPVPVKGLAAPIEVYELVRAGTVRSRLQALAAHGLTKFVGRTSELMQLQEAAAGAAAGIGQAVALVGEAGVGKSRLLQEFLSSERAEGWEVLELQAVSYGRETPYLPVIEFLKSDFRLEPSDDARAIREKVSGKVLSADPELQDAVAPMLDLLGALPEDHSFRNLEPEQRRKETVSAFARVLLAESRLRPLIVVFEDLHWNDSLTLGLLKGLLASLEGARILLLVSYRPEHRDEWSGRPRYRLLHVEPLPRDSVGRMLEGLLGGEHGLSGLKSFLIDRTEGNPFFIEEIVRKLAETGVLVGARGDYRLAKSFSSIQVPATVQAVLASRIDRLPPEQKRLLQDAAVVGNTVPYSLLRAITGLQEGALRDQLASLQAAELLYETRLYPDLEYSFKHALTHEVAYGGLLQERKRDIHARALRAMEDLYANQLDEHVERLAYHALNAELWEKALRYLRQAGAKAADRPASREALALYDQALAVLPHLPQDRSTLEQAIDIRFDIRNVLQPLGDRERIAGYLRDAEQLAVQLGDVRRQGWIQSYLTDYYWMLGRTQEAATVGERALGIARQLEDLPLQVVTNLPLGLLYHTEGDYPRARQYFEWNVSRLEGDSQYDRFGLFVLPSSFSRAFLAWCYAELGEFDKGDAIGEEGVRIAESARHPFSCGYAHLGVGVLRLRQGDLPRAIISFERALAAGAFADIPVGYAYVAFHLGYALALSGRESEGIAMLEETISVAEASGFVARHSLRLAYLAEAYLVAGRGAEAASTVLRALELARTHNERGNEAFAQRVLGKIESGSGAAAEAEKTLGAAIELAQSLGMRPLVAECHWDLYRALTASGRESAASSHRDEALAMYRSMNMHRSINIPRLPRHAMPAAPDLVDSREAGLYAAWG